MPIPQPRKPERSFQIQGWISPEQHDVFTSIAAILTKRTGRHHKPIDAVRYLADSGRVKSFAQGRSRSL